MEGVNVISFAKRLFEQVCIRLDPWYARAECTEEFSAKNISSDRGGTEAIGVDIGKSLPGLYWLNYFGSVCVESVGKDRFEACAAFDKKPINEGYMFALGSDPGDWSKAEYVSTEQQAMMALGKEYFFLRSDSKRPTRSPFAMGATTT